MKLSRFILLIAAMGLLTSPVYAKKDKHNQLPPGLQKKQMKGKSLPPGWEKKLAKGEILNKEVYKQSQIVIPVDKKGLLTIKVEGKLIKLYEATREIVEVFE